MSEFVFFWVIVIAESGVFAVKLNANTLIKLGNSHMLPNDPETRPPLSG